jgi:hypothetical protein
MPFGLPAISIGGKYLCVRTVSGVTASSKALYQVTFDTVEANSWNTPGTWNANKFTAPVAGVYHLSAAVIGNSTVNWEAPSVAVLIKRNFDGTFGTCGPANVLAANSVGLIPNTGHVRCCCDTVVALAAGDVVTVWKKIVPNAGGFVSNGEGYFRAALLWESP